MINRLYEDYIERRNKVQFYADTLKIKKRPQNTTKTTRLTDIQYKTYLESIDILCNDGSLEKMSLGYKYKDSHFKTKYEYKATEMGEEWCNMLDEVVRTLKQEK